MAGSRKILAIIEKMSDIEALPDLQKDDFVLVKTEKDWQLLHVGQDKQVKLIMHKVVMDGKTITQGNQDIQRLIPSPDKTFDEIKVDNNLLLNLEEIVKKLLNNPHNFLNEFIKNQEMFYGNIKILVKNKNALPPEAREFIALCEIMIATNLFPALGDFENKSIEDKVEIIVSNCQSETFQKSLSAMIQAAKIYENFKSNDLLMNQFKKIEISQLPGKSASDLMITPVQHVPRYALTMKEIINTLHELELIGLGTGLSTAIQQENQHIAAQAIDLNTAIAAAHSTADLQGAIEQKMKVYKTSAIICEALASCKTIAFKEKILAKIFAEPFASESPKKGFHPDSVANGFYNTLIYPYIDALMNKRNDQDEAAADIRSFIRHVDKSLDQLSVAGFVFGPHAEYCYGNYNDEEMDRITFSSMRPVEQEDATQYIFKAIRELVYKDIETNEDKNKFIEALKMVGHMKLNSPGRRKWNELYGKEFPDLAISQFSDKELAERYAQLVKFPKSKEGQNEKLIQTLLTPFHNYLQSSGRHAQIDAVVQDLRVAKTREELREKIKLFLISYYAEEYIEGRTRDTAGQSDKKKLASLDHLIVEVEQHLKSQGYESLFLERDHKGNVNIGKFTANTKKECLLFGNAVTLSQVAFDEVLQRLYHYANALVDEIEEATRETKKSEANALTINEKYKALKHKEGVPKEQKKSHEELVQQTKVTRDHAQQLAVNAKTEEDAAAKENKLKLTSLFKVIERMGWDPVQGETVNNHKGKKCWNEIVKEKCLKIPTECLTTKYDEKKGDINIKNTLDKGIAALQLTAHLRSSVSVSRQSFLVPRASASEKIQKSSSSSSSIISPNPGHKEK